MGQPFYNAKDNRYYIQVGRGSKRKKMIYARYLMEQKLGRKLETWEHVHHKDKDTTNDSLDNLEVQHRVYHNLFHKLGTPRKPAIEAHPNRVFTQEQADHYRKLYTEGKLNILYLSHELNIKYQTLYSIIVNRRGYGFSS